MQREANACFTFASMESEKANLAILQRKILIDIHVCLVLIICQFYEGASVDVRPISKCGKVHDFQSFIIISTYAWILRENALTSLPSHDLKIAFSDKRGICYEGPHALRDIIIVVSEMYQLYSRALSLWSYPSRFPYPAGRYFKNTEHQAVNIHRYMQLTYETNNDPPKKIGF